MTGRGGRVIDRAASRFFACVGCLVAGVAVANAAEPKPELEAGIGTAWSPTYSGSRASVAQLRLWANGNYPTTDFGTVALDSGSLTIDPELRWDFVDLHDAGIGALLGYRPGRSDRNPAFVGWSSGADTLRGLPNVPGAFDAGAQGFVSIFGFPLFAQVRSALGGAQGTLVNLGAFATFSIRADTELSVLPTVTWANARQMQAFYGVAAGTTSAAGFAPYTPGAGWQNAALEIGGDWRVLGAWHVVASIAYQRLLGAAAASPIVETRNQASGLIGLVRHF